MGLSHNLALAAQKQGYQSPFPIQEQAIPHILEGKDVKGIAPTGSGKSAAFIMPILDRLQDQKIPKSRNLQVLVLVPTRELAMQIYDVFIDMCEPLKREIRSMAVYGGVSINPQMNNLYGTEILVATPGRLLELLEHNALSLHEVQHLVIDEADKMF